MSTWQSARYLADLCIPVTSVEGRRQLCSATTGTLLLPRVQTSTGQRSFAVFGPATWNRLPPSLWAHELSLSTFKRLLKNQFFPACVNHRPAPLWLNSEFGAAYKYPDSTQLNQPYYLAASVLHTSSHTISANLLQDRPRCCKPLQVT